MKKIESFDEYKIVIREFRKEYRRPFSNIYDMPSDIERYIRLGRLEYEKVNGGLVFFFDEESYYKVCLFVNENEEFVIPVREKMLYVRNVFVDKEADLLLVEKKLTELGFVNVASTVEVRGDVKTLWEGCSQIKKHVDYFERQGYRCVEAGIELYDEIEEIILNSKVIKNYHLNYETEEEKTMLEKGCYLCIVNKDQEICGVSTCSIQGESGHGIAIAIKDEYKMKGFAPILAYYRYKWLLEHNIKFMTGWIVTTNSPSIRYHASLGYQFTDKHADEWVLEV